MKKRLVTICQNCGKFVSDCDCKPSKRRPVKCELNPVGLKMKCRKCIGTGYILRDAKEEKLRQSRKDKMEELLDAAHRYKRALRVMMRFLVTCKNIQVNSANPDSAIKHSPDAIVKAAVEALKLAGVELKRGGYESGWQWNLVGEQSI